MTQVTDPTYAALMRLAERIAPTPNEYLDRPVDWTVEKLGEWNTDVQEAIMESVRDNPATAVPSAHGTGKSRTASRIAAHWIDSHPPGEALVVTTAPTTHQIGAILWREIAKAHRTGKLVGRIVTGTNEWKINWGPNDDELVGFGKKPADYNAVALTGHHARYVLVIIDEACGVAKAIFDACDALLTNRHARILAIGNPDDPSSYFQKICQPGSGWNVMHIDGLQLPTMTREEVSKFPALREYMIANGIKPSEEFLPEHLRDMLTDAGWFAERLRRWGPTSPMFISKVRGRFPTIAVDSLIHPHWVKLAMLRETEPVPMFGRIAVDVARYGHDKSIILFRQGGHCRVVHEIDSGPVTEVAGLVIKLGIELGVQLPLAAVDDTGVGGGVTDILEDEDYPVMPIIAGSASTQMLPNGKPRFVNYRSELLWNLRDALAGPSGTGDDGWLDLDPEDEEMEAQLTNIKYKVNRHGQIAVETKDDMKSRGVDSPDRADALSYALAPDARKLKETVQPGRMITEGILTAQW